MVTKWPTIPPNGWHYFQGESRVEGETFEQLADNLASYRAANHLPAGDPKSDIENYVASKWPHILGLKESPADDKPETVLGKQGNKRLAERAASWCATRFAKIGALHFVAPEIAQRRANICVACKFNRGQWKREAIESCPGSRSNVEAVEVLAYKIRQGRTVEREGKLGACQIFGHDGQVAVHLDADGLKHRIHYLDFAPSPCWLRLLPKLQSIDTSTALAQPTAK